MNRGAWWATVHRSQRVRLNLGIKQQKRSIKVGIQNHHCPRLPFFLLSSAQLLNCSTLCDPMDCSMPGLPAHHQLQEFTQTHVHRVGDAIQHLILCRPLLLPPSIFSRIRVFSNESVLHIRWAKYWSFSFSIIPSSEYSGPIFRMDWLDLLAVQGTLKSPTAQIKSINSSALSFLYGANSHIHT